MGDKLFVDNTKDYNLVDLFRSDFRKSYSTITDFLGITNIILSTLNRNTCCQLIPLDISPSVDTKTINYYYRDLL